MAQSISVVPWSHPRENATLEPSGGPRAYGSDGGVVCY